MIDEVLYIVVFQSLQRSSAFGDDCGAHNGWHLVRMMNSIVPCLYAASLQLGQTDRADASAML